MNNVETQTRNSECAKIIRSPVIQFGLSVLIEQPPFVLCQPRLWQCVLLGGHFQLQGQSLAALPHEGTQNGLFLVLGTLINDVTENRALSVVHSNSIFFNIATQPL